MSVDYEDMAAMSAGGCRVDAVVKTALLLTAHPYSSGTAEAWLVTFTKELRKKLPSPYISAYHNPDDRVVL